MHDFTLWSPHIQLGFAGFAFAMLGVVVWMIRNLLKVLRETNAVITANTSVISNVQGTATETRELMIEIKDHMLQRPCLLKRSEQAKILAAHEAT